MAEKQTKKRVFLTLAQRMTIVNRLAKGELVKTLSREYKASPAAIRRIRRESSMFRSFENRGKYVLQHKNRRKSSNEDLENRLYSWFLEQQATGSRVRDSLLREKARELIHEHGFRSFAASRGWLQNFKKRYGIRSLRADREEGSADDETAPTSAINLIKEEHIVSEGDEEEGEHDEATTEVDEEINNLEADLIEKKKEDLIMFENIVKKYVGNNQEWLMVAAALKQFIEKQPLRIPESNPSPH